MSEVAAIGAELDVGGFRLAGSRVYVADDDQQVDAAWNDLPESVGIVIVTSSAAAALGSRSRGRTGPLMVVMPT